MITFKVHKLSVRQLNTGTGSRAQMEEEAMDLVWRRRWTRRWFWWPRRGNWQAQGGQGDGYQSTMDTCEDCVFIHLEIAFQVNEDTATGAWGGQQQPMSGVWGQQTPMGNYNQAGYGRGQSSGGQWNQSYGGGYGSSQQQQQQQPSSQYGGGYTSAQTQGYGDQYSQGAAYNANQGYSANYSGAYGTTQPQQSQYGSQAATGYSAQGSYGAGYANTSNNYGQQTQQQQTAVPDPNSSGGPMRGSGYGQRVGNNTHGYHPYGK
ncbi:hypothetical protein BSL78_08637 [Apostichopus japonicus]|uniref:Uncharacterized protein n=1 Tax=Stichopus japonicus TaxID=307972 RepID=A0A2G8L2E2_STIJA|nr:hypothetical protein BSL78_08637 [Apostichopus japonicus]